MCEEGAEKESAVGKDGPGAAGAGATQVPHGICDMTYYRGAPDTGGLLSTQLKLQSNRAKLPMG